MSTLAHTWPEHAAAASRGAPQDGIRYTVTLPVGAQRTLARGWLWLAMVALIGSGLFSLLLVLSRTPGVNRWLPGVDFFRVALVVHVDLSVLVWFVALAGMLWSLNGSARALAWGWAALGLCAYALARWLGLRRASSAGAAVGISDMTVVRSPRRTVI